MPQVVSFINMKGGVGKTTLAVNIGHTLVDDHSKKVLLVDLDPQANSSTYLMDEASYLEHISNDNKHTVLDIFKPKRDGGYSTISGKAKPAKRGQVNLTSCLHSYQIEGNRSLDLIPCSLNLMEIEWSQRRTEDRLAQFLRTKASHYDYILIDCPPTISIFTQAAILASDKYVVPLKPDPLSTIGLPLLERWLLEYMENIGKEITPVGIVFCMVRGKTPAAMQQVMTEIKNARKDQVFDALLGESTKVAESVVHHQPVTIYAKGTKWADQLKAITAEFLARTEED